MSTDGATPRLRNSRRGASHLTLVTDDASTLTIRVADVELPAEPAAGRHAAPRPLPVTGSVTMRALLALGALAAILGLCTGRAEAVYGSPDKSRDPTEADPEPPAAVDTLTTTADEPKTRTAAGSWEPAVKPVQVHTFTVTPADPGTGKHRRPDKPAAEDKGDRDEWKRPDGRHRRPGTPGAGHGHDGGGRHHHDHDRNHQGQHHGHGHGCHAPADGAPVAV
ncbi:hypothetical protein ACGF3G_00460 [Streptomyces sp. NPDC048179]|uniref:hypothetical protein n=1 Tax=Streptomyces sp. NPDC048179 TaxID=3365506 RepID=UPI0037168EEB